MKFIITEEQLREVKKMMSPIKVGVGVKTKGELGDRYDSFFKEFDSEMDLNEWVEKINDSGDKSVIGIIRIDG